ncbi:Protein tyrosine phosphatase [Rhodovastum atsumiense]|uniref:Protein tyrosine phosphatase n=1 Tax=Rhodovastum atsumiense TaxID=504468 RepID=A0A5M6IY54_9PROT|nr:sulfur transferase domain-containing protein [Rhodovastum atsumiense]KAA5612295.1 protein tyrosine phosphatase [Rhodovastum atsumiense]CAH2601625.1 Protein tyrosine phosphatase [Rhodovastum atsumiense]
MNQPALSVWADSLLADHAVFRAVWDNFAEVIPGKLYRSSHPTPGRLARLVRRYGIRTLINLRGEKPNGSNTLSLAAAQRLGLTHLFLPFESRGAPHRDRILRFHEIYRSMTPPALIHCKSGADRAGLAAGLAVLFEGGSAEAALRQLSWRHGHISHSPTGILDAFFRLYAATGEGRMPFLDWVRDEYDEAALRASFASRGFSRFLNDHLLRRE